MYRINISLIRLSFIIIFIVFGVFLSRSGNGAEEVSFQEKKGIFENKISEVAEQYIGIQYVFGGDLKESRGLDNSHLFCLIYYNAARKSGLRFEGYMPMKVLLKNTIKVNRNELRNGDLIVLNNGDVAMIYKFETRDKFYMIYSSFSRKEIVSFNSQNVVFEVYWLENLKDFYRLKRGMFIYGEDVD